MKKFIFTCLLLGFIHLGYSQGTYYWVGGATGTSSFSFASNWNTALDGSGTQRVTANNADVLIFDGTNIGGSTPTAGTVTPIGIATHTISQLILQNGANVVIQRGTSSGTGTITITGDGGPSDDLQIDATSSLKITSIAAAYNEYIKLSKTQQATGTIYGTVTITDAGLGAAKLIDSSAVGSLVFAAGSKCFINNTTTAGYPFGNSATTVSTSSYLASGILFKAGSTLFYNGGFSPFTQTTTTAPAMTFEAGSNFVINAPLGTYTNIFNKHYFSNVAIASGITANADAAWYNVDTLTVNTGTTFNLSATGGYPISGNIVNNGTIGCASNYKSAQFVMISNTVPQSVGGTGTFNGMSGFSVGTDANVTLNADLKIGSDTIIYPTSYISGKLNLQGKTLNSTGLLSAGNIAVKAAATVTTSGTLSGNVVTLDVTKYSKTVNTANVALGSLVTGTNILPNTYIISLLSDSSFITLSKLPSGACTSFTISNGTAVITTSNTNGIDGSFATSGTKSFDAGVNYVFNAATTSPFAASNNNALGNVTFNAAITTNKSQNIGGILTLVNGNLTINNTDTLRLLSTASISGASQSQYIVTKVSGATVGTLQTDGFSASKIFPVGSPNNYLPVTITPSATDTFNVSVFEGLTSNGLPNGIALNASQKASAIDAVWVINPKTNIGQTAAINLSWTNALTGSRFFTFTNAQIGVGRNDGTNWLSNIAATANNIQRNVTASYTAYGSFGIGEANNLLPVQLISFTATAINSGAKLSWSAANEIAIANYVVEKSVNGTSFETIGSVNALNNASTTMQYSFFDDKYAAATSYYRLKIVSANGSISYSNTIILKSTIDIKLAAYPNPFVNALTVTGLKGGETIDVYDNAGKLILTKVVALSVNAASINTASLNSGFYTVKIVNQNMMTTALQVFKNK
ncbi:beta strand repeat-containing protein [Parasediminibacterium paludis]|uniref:Beta strand repeat-containing protein n=1 Tax=Parasediminibacterium paludis TaxID=908966 RepID=A0ABV8PTD3_9BACT